VNEPYVCASKGNVLSVLLCGSEAWSPASVLRGSTYSVELDSRLSKRGVVVNGIRRMNEVNARPARLVPGWVTVFGRVYHLGM